MTSDSITIVNNSSEFIEVTSVADYSVVQNDRVKKHTIGPKESFVFFTDRIVSLQWEKPSK